MHASERTTGECERATFHCYLSHSSSLSSAYAYDVLSSSSTTKKNPNDKPKFNSIAACNGIESEKVYSFLIFSYICISIMPALRMRTVTTTTTTTHQMKSLTYRCSSQSDAIMFYNALQLLIRFSALIRTILEQQPNIYRFRLFNPNSRLRRLVDWLHGKYEKKER